MKTVAELFSTLMDEGQIEAVGFDLPSGSSAQWAYGEVQCQDGFAAYMGKYVCTLVASRIRRELWFLRGWPIRCALFLDAIVAGEAIATFREDYTRFQRLQADPASATKVVRNLLERSVFHLPPVQHMVAICEQESWQAASIASVWTPLTMRSGWNLTPTS